MQRPCGRHVLRALEEQKEAQCDWGVERVEPTALLQIEAVYFSLGSVGLGGELGFSVHEYCLSFNWEKTVKVEKI